MASQMRAAVWLGAGERAREEEIQLAPPQPGEVEVEVAAAGVCHSDLHLALGHFGLHRFPTVLGHEGSGTVTKLGKGVDGLAIGDRISFCFLPSCGECRQCLRGRSNLCEPGSKAAFSGTMLDGTHRMQRSDGTALQQFLAVGAFAERTVVSARSVVKIPTNLAFDEAALVGCAVVTGFGAVRNAGRVQPGDRVAVIGCGGVGLQVIAAAAKAGADEIVAIDPVPEKAELALAQGATSFSAPESVTPGFDRVFEVVGRPETIENAWRLIAPGGAVIVVGIAPAGTSAKISAIDFSSEKSLIGSFYGSGNPAAEIAELAELVAKGELDLSRTVSHRTDLGGINDAFDRLQHGEGARTVVEL